MTDVAQMLGMGAAPSGGASSGGRPKPTRSKKGRKPGGVSREVFALLGPDSLPSMVPVSKPSRPGIKEKRLAKSANWSMKPFSSSARRDGVEFTHWARDDLEFPDYPFARFNRKVEIIRYTDDEYRRYLAGETSPTLTVGRDQVRCGGQRWSKEETDTLFDLCRRFDLRWSVIYDRYDLIPHRTIEELKHRFYSATRKVIAVRIRDPRLAASIASSGLRPFAQFHFNAHHEHQRRYQLEQLFLQRISTAKEEAAAKHQLKRLDAAIKKAGKTGGGTANRAWLQRLFSATGDELVDDVIPSMATAHATPACPVGSSLRSAQFKARLMSPCISRSAQQKVEKVLTELGVRPVPMPTERVIEEHSKLRQDILLMLALHKLVAKRQKQAAGLIEQRSRLANVGPASVLQAMTASRVAAQQAAQRAKAQAKAQQKALAAKKAAQAAAHASSASTAQMVAPAAASSSAASHSSKGAKNSKAASVSNKANSKKPNSKNARPHSGKKARTSAASKKKAAAAAAAAPAASGGGGKGFVSAGRGEVMAIGGGGKGKGTMPAPRSRPQKRRITITGKQANSKRARKS